MNKSQDPKNKKDEAANENIQKRLNTMFSDQEPPSYASVREVDAMKARINELEVELARQEELKQAEAKNTDVKPRQYANTAKPKRSFFNFFSSEETVSNHSELQVNTAFRIMVVLIIVILMSLPFYIYSAVKTGAWQVYTITAGLVACSAVIVYGISLIRRKRIEQAMELIVVMACFLIPLIVALVSGLGIVLAATLFLVTFTVVGQTLSGRRATRSIFAGFVFSVLTLFIDIVAPWTRLSIPILQSSVPIISTVLIALLVILMARQFRNYKIRGKLVVMFVVVTLVSVIALSFVANQITTRQFDQVLGVNLHELATRMAREVGDSIVKSKIALDGLALNKFVQDSVVEANSVGVSDATSLANLDQQWTNAADGDPLVNQVLSNELSVELKEFRSRLPQYAEVFITDQYGSVIASTDRTSDYSQADEDWWKTAWNNGKGSVYVSQPVYDASAGIYAIDIALPIPSHNGSNIVGVLRATVDINELTSVLTAAQLGKTGQAVLALPNNRYLTSEAGINFSTFSRETTAGLTSIGTSYGKIAYEGVPSLVSQIPVTSITTQDRDIINELRWSIVVHQDIPEAHLPITNTTQGLIFTAIGVLLITGLLAVFVGGQFARPIENLTAVAEQAANGDLSIKAAEQSQDEIGILSNTFNRMTSQLRETLLGLEERVSDRTHDLELASEVGQAITERVANLSALLSEAAELIRSRFNLYYTQIYLIDPAGRNLNLRAGTGEAGQQLLRRGHHLLISSSSLNGRAVLEKQPVLVGDTKNNPNFLPNVLLPLTRSELAVPLIAGGKVVGVLDMQSEKPETFSNANIPAFQVLAGQLSIAIQNSILFTEADEARVELEEQARRLTQTGWQDYLDGIDRTEKLGFVFDQTEVLPLTKLEAGISENALVVPIQITGANIGEIRLSDENRKWTNTEREVVQATVSQIGQHIESLRLLSQAEQYRLEAEQATRRLTREGWDEYLKTQKEISGGYSYNQDKVVPLKESNRAEAVLSHPLVIRNESIGEVTVHSESQNESHASEILTAVAEQLSNHIENLRLLEQAEISRLEVEKSQEQYELAIEGSNDGLWDWDIAANTVYFSPRWKAMVGYGEDELNNGFADFEKLLHPADHDWALASVNDYLAGKLDEYDIQFRFQHKDGSYRWIRARGKALRNPDGSPYRMAGSHTDITQSKESEEIVREAQERAQTILESVTLPMIITRLRDSLAVFINQPAADTVKVNYDEAINQPAPNFYYDLNERAKFLAELRENGKVENMTVQLLRAGKEKFWALLSARMFEYQGEPSILTTFIDITDRITAQEEVIKRAAELQTVAEVSITTARTLDPDYLLQTVVDLSKEKFHLYHAHIYLVDDSWNTLLLASGSGETGRQMVTTGHSISMEAEKSLVARAAREREAIIVNNVRSEEDFLPNSMLPETRAEMALPMVAGDKVIGVFDVQSEIEGRFTQEDASIFTTLASQVAIALQNARSYVEQAATVTQLRELDRLKSSFLANMSHELRTPLNSILGFTDVMLEELDGPLTPNMDTDLKLIQKNGKHLLHLINDVLDMAKIESGKMNLLIENFNLHEIIEEVIGITSSLANEKNLALYTEPDSNHEVEISADHTRLRQVMINVVNNAIKFTEKGSISIRATKEENNVLISVHDTGIGIPISQLEDVFLEFTQVDTSTTRKAGGTGLGLPISRKLIEMHGGRLWAESNGINGEGSTFYIFLPLEAKPTKETESEPLTRK